LDPVARRSSIKRLAAVRRVEASTGEIDCVAAAAAAAAAAVMRTCALDECDVVVLPSMARSVVLCPPLPPPHTQRVSDYKCLLFLLSNMVYINCLWKTGAAHE